MTADIVTFPRPDLSAELDDAVQPIYAVVTEATTVLTPAERILLARHWTDLATEILGMIEPPPMEHHGREWWWRR